MIKTAAIPLLGLALLQIAAELGPHDPLLKNRARLCSFRLEKLLGFFAGAPPMLLFGTAQGKAFHG